MTKSEKREAAIRQKPKQVRFDDLNTLLRSYDFNRRQSRKGSSHYIYWHPLLREDVTVPQPHGPHVDPVYVKKAPVAIDAVKASEG